MSNIKGKFNGATDQFPNLFNAIKRGDLPPKKLLAGFRSFMQIFVNNTLFNPAFVLRKNPGMYDVMNRDTHLYAALRTRKEYTASLPWIIEENENDPQDGRQADAVKFLTQVINEIPNFREVIINILDALLPGMSVQEIEWEFPSLAKPYIGIKNIIPRGFDQFVYTVHGQLKLLTRTAPDFGMDIVDPDTGDENSGLRFIVHTFNMSPGTWEDQEKLGQLYYGSGVGDVVYWPIYFKTNGMMQWMRWMDRYAVPTRYATYPATNEQMRDSIVGWLEQMTSDVDIVLPQDKDQTYGLDFKGPQLGRFDVFQNLMEYLNKEMSKAVLGETLTLEQGTVGALALGRVHENSLLMKIDFDSQSVAETLTRTIVQLLLRFNAKRFPGIEQYPPSFKFILDNQVERDNRKKDIAEGKAVGIKVPKKFAHKIFNIPEAKEDPKTGEMEETLPDTDAGVFSMEAFDGDNIDNVTDKSLQENAK